MSKVRARFSPHSQIRFPFRCNAVVPNVFWVKGRIIEPIVNWLYMFQNFHLIHHLFPRIPFYLYPKAFRSLKPVLEKERAHIYEFGH